MVTRPDRHHASRWSSSIQAMAYTVATNRHITPKPGQGWREWAAMWTLVIWLPAWVGQNSVTGFRHESGSAWAIPGRPNRTAIIAAMAAAGCRSKAPAATLSTARAARYSPPPATARATPGSPSAAWGAWPLMRACPTKNAAKQVTSPTTKVTTARTSALAASTRPRFGTAIRLVRIIPDEYSELIKSTPNTTMASWAIATPAWLTPVGSQLCFSETLNLGEPWALAALMTAPRATPSTTVTVSAQNVDRTERSLTHSEFSTSAKVDARKAARWSGPVRAIAAPVIGPPRPPGIPRCLGSVP